MALRKGHGNGKGKPRIEVLPADEAKPSLPVELPAEAQPLARRPNGTIADSEAAKALGARGGKAKAENKALLKGLGLSAHKMIDGAEFKSYLTAATAWVEAEMEDLSAYAGGYLGAGAMAIIVSAAKLKAAADWAWDKAHKPDGTVDIPMIDKSNSWYKDMRQQILAAKEQAHSEGEGRLNMLRAKESHGQGLFDLAGNKEGEGG